ncbi:MAG: FtsX-like permease family protein [Thermodesulfobacteriota bacterium]|nr:FtsX-like permease family protein [Thermodesulfobacteriota bacterium]
MSIEIKMAWRNIWRNSRRSILTILAIVFATMLLVFMLSFQFGSYDTMINTAVKIHTGHVQVQAEGYRDKMDTRLVVPDPGAVDDVIKDIPEIEAYTSRANAFSLVSSSDRTYGVLLTGIDPEREAKVSTLKKLVRRGEYLAQEDTDMALVGKLLARNLKVDIGDELVVLGQGRDGSVAASVLKVKGIFSSGEDKFDRNSVQMPLGYFQDVFFMRGAVHEVVVLGRFLEDVKKIKKELGAGVRNIDSDGNLAVLDWMELMPGIVQSIKLDLVSGLIMYVILIVVVAFSILNTFLMAIFERTREFGVLMAIGMTPGRLMRSLFLESVTITLIGIILGIISGGMVTWYFQVHGILISGASELLSQYGLPERMYPQLSVLSISVGAGIVLIITILTAIYPVLKVRRLKPVEAMTAV